MVRRTSQRRGSTLLEFALTFPIYIMVLLGIVDSGWMYFQQSSIDSATRVACRIGTTVDPGAGASKNLNLIYDAVNSAVPEQLQIMGVPSTGVSISVTTTNSPPLETLICTVSQDFVPPAGFVLPQGTLTATTAMRLEFQRD